MADRIRILIRRTEAWKAEHIRAGRQIEAAACAIRLRAPNEALEIVGGERAD